MVHQVAYCCVALLRISTYHPMQGAQAYNLQERAEFVSLLHQYKDDTKLNDSGAFQRRLRGIQVLAAICQRQDIRRELPTRSIAPLVDPKILWQNEEDVDSKRQFPMVCKPRQCVWCLGDSRKSYEARIF